MPHTLLSDIFIIYALAMGVVIVFHRLHIPTVVGFLVTGVVAGPNGLGLISSMHEVEILAEIGVVLLLFTIGLEFSFRELMEVRKPLLLGGGIQVGLCLAAGWGAAWALGLSQPQALFMGFLVALSSTAIVLKLLADRAMLGRPEGRTALAILLFQDIIVVGMLLVTPILGDAKGGGGLSGPTLLIRGAVVILALFLLVRWLVPKGLNRVTATRDRELFIITIVTILMGVAWLTSWAGLSLALGAFLAGLIVAESQYSHQTIGSIIPLRDLFTSLFFVSIGMLLDLGFVAKNPLAVGLGAAGVILGKVLLAGAAARVLGLSLPLSLAAGLVLGQVGEFSFVLARAGIKLNLLSQSNYQLVLAVSVVTMAVTPLLAWLGDMVGQGRGPGWLQRAKTKRGVSKKMAALAEPDSAGKPKVLIVGFGINGRNVARAATSAGISYAVIEMNPATVRRERESGRPVYYGDAVSLPVLEQVGLGSAEVLAVTIADPAAARAVVATARAAKPGLYIIARTRFVQEVEALYNLGADEVVPEEYEAAVAIFSRVAQRLLLPQQRIEEQVCELRAEGYEMLRLDEKNIFLPDCETAGILHDLNLRTVLVMPGARADGATLAELELRKKTGVSVAAIRRGERTISGPGAEDGIRAGDYLVLLGKEQNMAAVAELFNAAGEKQ